MNIENFGNTNEDDYNNKLIFSKEQNIIQVTYNRTLGKQKYKEDYKIISEESFRAILQWFEDNNRGIPSKCIREIT